MKKILVLCLVVFVTTGCATLTGKSKPQSMDLTYGWGYEDRDEAEERTSMNVGPVVTFDNGHKVAFNYRYRDEKRRNIEFKVKKH